MVCKEYTVYIYFLGFNFYVYKYIFVDLEKYGVLTLVGEIMCYRNDHYCYYY